ncbi:unnamed protein product [Linum trigynum]|uniref:Uncharacterized protein n=1 Tax=Linum trigynum TaxID=586398 RepID=A0AAV2F7A2_9ROSI
MYVVRPAESGVNRGDQFLNGAVVVATQLLNRAVVVETRIQEAAVADTLFQAAAAAEIGRRGRRSSWCGSRILRDRSGLAMFGISGCCGVWGFGLWAMGTPFRGYIWENEEASQRGMMVMRDDGDQGFAYPKLQRM